MFQLFFIKPSSGCEAKSFFNTFDNASENTKFLFYGYYYTGQSKSLCVPDGYSKIIRFTDTFWSHFIL